MSSICFDALGTKWEVSLPYKEIDSKLENKIKERIEVFDSIYSRFREDSLISKMSKETGIYELPADAKPLFDLYQRLYTVTDGSFTPIIGSALVEAGYDKKYSFQVKKLNKVSDFNEAVEYNFPKITLKQPLQFDFGAAGKGYIMDLVGEMLQKNQIDNYTIDAGHDLLLNGYDKPLRIALEHPADVKMALGVAVLASGSICASSGNRRKWGEYHHIIDANALQSPKDILGSWTTADTALVADGLATALFFTKPEILGKYFDFEYLIIYSDYSLDKSDNFPIVDLYV